MNLTKKQIATILLSLSLCASVRADTHYCDLSLSADGAGTASDPWQWSQACNAANVSAGDTVYVCGTRATAISLTASNAKGTSGNVITYAAWEDQSPPPCRSCALRVRVTSI
jgi:hypothetical protein